MIISFVVQIWLAERRETAEISSARSAEPAGWPRETCDQQQNQGDVVHLHYGPVRGGDIRVPKRRQTHQVTGRIHHEPEHQLLRPVPDTFTSSVLPQRSGVPSESIHQRLRPPSCRFRTEL